MSIEQAVLSYLLVDAGVAALISGRGALLVLEPKPTLPAIRVQLIDEVETYVLAGTTNYFQARLQIDAYDTQQDSGHDPYESVRAIGRAVSLAIDGRGFTDPGSPVALTVSSCRLLARIVEDEDNGEQRLVRMRQDFRVTYREV